MGQEMITFSAPQGVPVKQEIITFSALQGVPVGQEMIAFSAPQGVPLRAGNDHLFCPAGSPCGAGNDHFFLPHRDRPQDITTSIKHCNIQRFLFPPRTKQRCLRCFLFCEHQNRVKTLVFTMFLQQRKRCFWRMPENQN